MMQRSCGPPENPNPRQRPQPADHNRSALRIRMTSSKRFLKPISSLRIAHLKDRPFWEFATDTEGVKGQDETSVEPIPAHESLDGRSFFAVVDFLAANGKKFVGLIDVELGFTTKIQPCAIVTRTQYAPLPSPGQSLVQHTIEYSEKLLGFPLAPLFPLQYRTRAPIEEYSECLEGIFKSLPK